LILVSEVLKEMLKCIYKNFTPFEMLAGSFMLEYKARFLPILFSSTETYSYPFPGPEKNNFSAVETIFLVARKDASDREIF
jgi:hypothetical protein